ncbi:hypothetical protein CKAN_00710700 [Cinnamomum micranthum f. kanehirae]|uniref:KIB1-4 beta-propeller domain-containing protein n=1 Tax=Cinnamomum micranthum f. kanehirae TaxID=337451 RepID=A0A3S4NKV3_9MAGN|nr:hypothetical protein CKAN_00710700 [Cinnamomum micranthum f. kanehirae]
MEGVFLKLHLGIVLLPRRKRREVVQFVLRLGMEGMVTGRCYYFTKEQQLVPGERRDRVLVMEFDHHLNLRAKIHHLSPWIHGHYYLMKNYFVEWRGEILLVVHDYRHDDGIFHVYKIGSSWNLVKVKSLGDGVIFLTNTQTRCFSASDFPTLNLKGNCICYLPITFDPNKGVYFFYLEDGRSEWCNHNKRLFQTKDFCYKTFIENGWHRKKSFRFSWICSLISCLVAGGIYEIVRLVFLPNISWFMILASTLSFIAWTFLSMTILSACNFFGLACRLIIVPLKDFGEHLNQKPPTSDIWEELKSIRSNVLQISSNFSWFLLLTFLVVNIPDLL